MSKPKIDFDLCTGCGTCEALCPDIFQLRDDGKAYVIKESGCNGCNCQDAVDSCPEGAISLE